MIAWPTVTCGPIARRIVASCPTSETRMASTATMSHGPAGGISPEAVAGMLTLRISPGRTNIASPTATNRRPSWARIALASSQACDSDSFGMNPPLLAVLMRGAPAARNQLAGKAPSRHFAPCDGNPDRHRMARERRAGALCRGAGVHGAARRRDPRGDGEGMHLAPRTPTTLHGGNERGPRRAVQSAGFPGLRSRPRGTLHLSRAGAARRLRDARPRKARKGHPLLRPFARRLDDRFS